MIPVWRHLHLECRRSTHDLGVGLLAGLWFWWVTRGTPAPAARLTWGQNMLGRALWLLIVANALGEALWFSAFFVPDVFSYRNYTVFLALHLLFAVVVLARLPTPWTALGAVCFAVSDAMIGINKFVLGSEALAVPIWWAYATALMLITAGFFFGRTSHPSARR